jgi:hypothetical protein
MSDNPLSENYFMVGTIPVLLHKKEKKISILPELMSSTVSVESKLKRKFRIDLGLGQGNKNNYSSESNLCSGISNSKTSSMTGNFTTNHNESPRQSHLWKKDDAALSNRRYNNWQTALNLRFNYDICCKRNSTLTGATPLKKNDENGIEFEIQEDETHKGILRPGMVLLKNHLTHNEQVLYLLIYMSGLS